MKIGTSHWDRIRIATAIALTARVAGATHFAPGDANGERVANGDHVARAAHADHAPTAQHASNAVEDPPAKHAHDPLAQGSVSFDAALPADLEVVRAPTGHLLVRPTVNGQQPGWFIFDTGAGICVVSTPFVTKLDLASMGSISAVGVGGGENAGLFRASTLTLGRITLRDHPVMTTDLSFLEAHLGKEIVGVIGYGVLSQCVAEMDLVTPRVALFEPASYALARGEWTPMDIETRIPAVRARFEGREGLFSLDTGSNTPLAFNAAAVREWSLLENREVTDGKKGGVGGFVPIKRGIVDWVEFAGVRQEKVSTTFAVEDKGTDAETRRQGTIGADLLRPFSIVTDYAAKRIAFRPREVMDATPATSR